MNRYVGSVQHSVTELLRGRQDGLCEAMSSLGASGPTWRSGRFAKTTKI